MVREVIRFTHRKGTGKHEIRNSKWFDQLTTLSKVEGQITITQIQMTKTLSLTCCWADFVLNFEHSDFDIASARPGATQSV